MKPTGLLCLPTETLCTIIMMIPDSVASLNMMRTCKRIHALFDATQPYGKRVWKSLREREGWPDPSRIGLSEYSFIKAIYGRGCNNCDIHPRMRSPIWEFQGIRLCKECYRTLTIRDYELDAETAAYALSKNLPHVVHDGYRSFPGYLTYSSYLRSSIDDLSTDQGSQGSYPNRLRLSFFGLEVERNQLALREARIDLDTERRLGRQKDINTYLAQHAPQLHPNLYTALSTYNAAVNRTTPFTARAQKIFHTKIMREIEQIQVEIDQ